MSFKKGQLVRSTNTGEFYLCGTDESSTGMLVLARVGKYGSSRPSYQRPRRNLQLIGNNYRPK